MKENQSARYYSLQPHWKQFFLWYLLSIILMPVLIGFLIFYLVRKKQQQYSYRIFDTHISAVKASDEQKIDLLNIERIEIKESWLQKKLDIGNLVLHTPSSQLILLGIDDPVSLKSMIGEAVANQRRLKTGGTRLEKQDTGFKPGSLDKMDYLTGLWQQGLLSDEDYNKEKKHFE